MVSSDRIAAGPELVARRLSVVVAALAAFESGFSIAVPSVFRDNLFVWSQLVGNDAVTLLVAVPTLLISLRWAVSGSVGARLVWYGVLDYMFYNYSFYLLGARFNVLFLVYAAACACSMLALIFGLVAIDANEIAARFAPRTPTRLVSVYMMGIAVGLGGLWVGLSLAFVFTGVEPPVIAATDHHTSEVFALDLTLLVPFLIVGAVLMWRRHPWGYIIGAILAVKGVVYPLALVMMGVGSLWYGVEGGGDLIPIWLTVMAAGVGASYALFSNLASPRKY